MDYTVVMYTGEGCMKCRITGSQFTKRGIEYTTQMADNHPSLPALVEGAGLKRQLPVVVVSRPGDEDMIWTGLDHDAIKALEHLVKGEIE